MREICTMWRIGVLSCREIKLVFHSQRAENGALDPWSLDLCFWGAPIFSPEAPKPLFRSVSECTTKMERVLKSFDIKLHNPRRTPGKLERQRVQRSQKNT